MERIQRAAERIGAPPARLLGTPAATAPLVVVDRLGVLATLYGAGKLAYVGGGFGRGRAAFGAGAGRLGPSGDRSGPHWQESRDAGRLVAAGGGARAASRRGPGHACGSTGWQDDAARAAMGARALAVVESERGASARSAALLDEVLQIRR